MHAFIHSFTTLILGGPRTRFADQSFAVNGPAINEWMNQSIDQSINQSINPSIRRSIHQSKKIYVAYVAELHLCPMETDS